MSDFDRVIHHPHSIAARRALAARWLETGDPRGRFASDQIDAYEGRFYPGDESRVRHAIIDAIEEHGREWAGEIAKVATDFRFQLGLVYSVAISVETFVERGMQLIREAPIIHIALWPPGDPTRVPDSPALVQMRSLAFGGGPSITDELVERLAVSPYVAGLRAIDLERGQITRRGVSALERLGSLPNIIYIDVTENPCLESLKSGRVRKVNGRTYIVGDAGRASLDEAYTRINQSYDPGGMLLWPPSKSEFSFVNDM